MPEGPGKYDDLCTYVREGAEAAAVIVIVLHGKHGDGFSVQARHELPPLEIARVLRRVAEQIEGDVQ